MVSESIYNFKILNPKNPQNPFIITGKFNEVLAVLKSIPNSQFNFDTKTWVIPNLEKYYIRLSPYDIRQHIYSYIKDYKTIQNRILEQLKKQFPKLYEFQIEAISKIITTKESTNYKGFIIGFTMGLGKTITSLYAAKYFKKKILIVAPASLRNMWKQEIIKWFGERFEKYVYIIDNTRDKRKFFYINSKLPIVIVSYDMFREDIYNFEPVIKQFLDDRILIFDEASKLKNKTTKVYKAIKRIFNKEDSKFYFSLFLTGTPVTNGLDDINNLVNLIAPELAKQDYLFKLYETITVPTSNGYRKVKKIVGYTNLDKYVEKIGNVYIRKNIEDVKNNLPKKNIITIPVNHSESYKELSKIIKEQFEPFVAFSLLCMLDSDFQVIQESESESVGELLSFLELPKDIPLRNFFYNRKLDALYQILDEVEEKVLIFTTYQRTARKLVQELQHRYKDKDIRIADSSIKNKQELAQEFNLTSKPDIVIATDVWSFGVNLFNIDYLINFDISPSLEKYLQRMDRIYRINSTRPKFIYNLVGDIIEKYIMKILQRKLTLAQNITEMKAGKVTKEAIRQEVLKQIGLIEKKNQLPK